MTSAEPGAEAGPERLPAWVRWGVLPLACLVLFLAFAHLQFPYARFREPVAQQLERATGARVEIAEMAGGLGLAGPHLEASQLALRWPDGASLALDRARLRPAWSLSWLRGSPALHVDAQGPVGRADLTLWPGPPTQLEGELRALQVGRLPLAALGGGALPLEGELDAELALTNGRRGPSGRVDFRARDGSLSSPELPLAIPYESVRGALTRADDGAVEVESFQLEGPLLSLSASGRIGPAASLDAAPLSLDVQISSLDPQIASALRPYGIRPEGGGQLALRGTLGAPRVRSR